MHLGSELSLWRRIIRWSAKTVVFAVTCTATLAFIAFVYSWYSDRPTPLKVWPDKKLEGSMTVSLKTASAGSQVRYQLLALPEPGTEEAFRTVADRIERDDLFTLILNDKDGFTLCKQEVDVTGLTDAQALGLAGFSSNGSFFCGKYRDAENWTLLFKPQLRLIRAEAEKARSLPPPQADRPKPARQSEAPGEDVAFDEVLVGFDFAGNELETKSGKTAIVSNAGAIEASMWTNGVRLRFKCKPGACTIENLANGHAVRAKLSDKLK